MIELKDLQQLIKIAECGTISRAAEELFLSQPALSRSMQRLEDELGVKLFSRAKNKVELNENGLFFVRTACSILENCDEGVRRLREFDRERNSFSVGSCAPAPMWELVKGLGAELEGRRLSAEIKGVDELVRGLKSGAYKIVIINRPVDEEGIVCREYCREKLLLCLPAEHRLASRKSLTFSDIDGITMLLYEGIGVWHDVSARLPHTRFIVQSGFDDFADLVRQSSLPSFATDFSLDKTDVSNRVVIPVEDDGAEQTFYVCALQAYKNLLPAARAAGQGEKNV